MSSATDLIQRLGGPGPRPAARPQSLIVRADEDRTHLAAYRTLRRRTFVDVQQIFAGDDGDEHDGGAHTVVLVAVAAAIGTLGARPGVCLRWPDADVTVALRGSLIGLRRPVRRAA